MNEIFSHCISIELDLQQPSITSKKGQFNNNEMKESK